MDHPCRCDICYAARDDELRRVREGERKRCAQIIMAARTGEVDTDLRAIKSMIESGWSVGEI